MTQAVATGARSPLPVTQQLFRSLGILFATVLVAQLLQRVFGISFAATQILVLPVIVLVLLKSPFLTVPAAQTVIIFSAAAATVAFIGGYLSEDPSHAKVLIVGLVGDEYEADTRAIAHRVNREIGSPFSTRVRRVSDTVSSWNEASALMSRFPDVRMLIWGQKEWLNLTFPQRNSFPLGENVEGDLPARLNELQVILSPPVVGLSLSPRVSTSHFVAQVLEGVLAIQDGREAIISETQLREAAQLQAFWTSGSHRGLAWNLLGVVYLKRFFRGGATDLGVLQCAREAFYAASGATKAQDNPELFAAALGNAALVEYLFGLYTGDRWPLQVSRYRFRQIRTLRALRNPYRLPMVIDSVVQQNFQIAFGGERKAKKKKGRKRRIWKGKDSTRGRAARNGKKPKKGRGRSIGDL